MRVNVEALQGHRADPRVACRVSRVAVRVECDGERPVLVVQDSGDGIAEAWRERVFDRFFRAQDQAQRGSGQGLGLAIVKAVADRHRAGVELSAGEGGCGLRAMVRLAVADASRPA